MATISVGIIMHGVTGRMGKNQHLIRSIVAIREQGGVELANGDRLMPDPILIGRNEEKLPHWRNKPVSVVGARIWMRRWPTQTIRSSLMPPRRRRAPVY